MKTIKIDILYLALHNNLMKKYGNNNIISKKEFFCSLGKHYLVPKPARAIVVEEMEQRGFIKKIDRDHIEILPFEINIETDINKLYKAIGLF